MRNSYNIYLAVLCLAINLTPLVLGICEPGWLQSGLYCYYFSVDNATQPDAQARCEVNFADLLYIDDDGENVFIFNNGPITTLESYWIGYELVFGDIWRWASTGKAGSYRKWDIGEPDGEGGCARLTPYIQGVWRDWDCNRALPYICKKFADCGMPDDMPLGARTITPEIEGVVTADTTIPRGSLVTYKCLDGMEFADEEPEKTAECSIGGIWLPDVVNETPCEPKQCLPPPVFGLYTLTNGTELTREFGSVVSYVCEDGYWFDQFSMNVTKYMYCANDKTWKGDEVNECTKVYCVRPVTSYARADTPLNSYGTVATYACDPGFEYEDNTTVKVFTCLENGWMPPPEQCMELRCPEFSVKNAIPSTESLAVFTIVTWVCEPGMRYPDTTTRKNMECQLDESWDRKITDGCERKRCLGVPPNASETFSHDWNNTNGEIFRYGDVVNYTCIPEWYFGDGETTRKVVCNEDGEWSPRVVTDCLGEIVEVKHGVTHKATESEGSATFGTIAMMILGVMLGSMVFFDIVTIGKHIQLLKDNLCSSSGGEKKEEPVGELDGAAVGNP